jgi:hypothetical protein
MTDSDNDHVLPNGNTFLVTTASGQGYWAKATDPVTAIKEVRRQEGSHWPKGKVPIAVYYGDAETLHVSDFGGVRWNTDKPYIPIGLFAVTERSIKPLQKADFEEGGSHLKWMAEELSNVERQVTKRKERRAAFEENVEKDPAVQELIAAST